MKFANVPNSRAENIVHGGPRVWHVNSVQNVQNSPVQDLGDISGVVKFKYANKNRTRVPDSVRKIETRSSDRFTNPVFSFTGVYPTGYSLVNVSSGTFVALAGMRESRAATNSVLTNGGSVIVAGGLTGNSLVPTSGSEIYYISSNTWGRLPDAPGGRFFHRLVYITGSGDVLSVGGQSSPPGLSLTSSFVYLSASNTWQDAGATNILFATGSSYNLSYAQAIQLNSGKVLYMGNKSGSTNFVSQLWDPSTKTWMSESAVPQSITGVYGFSVEKLNDGTGFLVGGRGIAGSSEVDSTASFRYNEASNVWIRDSDAPVGLVGLQTVILQDGSVACYGSSVVSKKSLYIYTPVTQNSGTWRKGGDFQTGIYGQGDGVQISAAGQGRIVSMCGLDATQVTGTFVYDVESSTWFRVGGPSAMLPLTVPIVTTGSIFQVMLLGGGDVNLSCSNKVYMFQTTG